jgi:hypothetical protein
MPVSKAELIRAIDTAETTYLWCWRFLRQRSGPELLLTDVLQFQDKLLSALSSLDAKYRLIAGEKNSLISRKMLLNATWLRRRLKTLEKYQKIVKTSLALGRTIGDGFAWLFYRSEDNLLDEHLKLFRQDILSPGVGGIGERAFVEKMQGIGGHFVISHTITSFLRLGDVSFFDPKRNKIAAIGELKTVYIGDDRYNITLGYVSGDNLPIFSYPTTSNHGEPAALSQKMKDRLARQMKQISSSIEKANLKSADHKLTTNSEFHFSDLNDAISQAGEGKFIFLKSRDSIVFCVYKYPGSPRLSQALFFQENAITKRLGGIEEAATSILNSSYVDNALVVANVGYSDDGYPQFSAGALPLIWWPLSEENLFRLIFHNVIAISLYNPAHLWSKLRSKGYTTEIVNGRDLKKASMKVNGRIIELHNIDYFSKF